MVELSFSRLEFREFLARQAFSSNPLPLCQGLVCRTCPVAHFLSNSLFGMWTVSPSAASLEGNQFKLTSWVQDYIAAFDTDTGKRRGFATWSGALHVLDTMPN